MQPWNILFFCFGKCKLGNANGEVKCNLKNANMQMQKRK